VDVADTFPLDANEHLDSDSDGVGDNADAFPTDGSETVDTDSWPLFVSMIKKAWLYLKTIPLCDNQWW
jgi:hypothetical protein